MCFSKRFTTIFLTTIFLFATLAAGRAFAVTMSASPTTAPVNQVITVTIRSSYSSIVTPCFMQVNFGDGSGWANVAPACATPPCTNRVTHSYSTPGTYTIQTRTNPSDIDCVALIYPPPTASVRVTITEPQEINLPDGVVGMDYEYELGDRTNRYTKTGGKIDHGLKIVRNTIKGVPEREGKYRFRIRATDRLGTTTDTWYNLQVIKALLKVTVTPKKAQIDRNRAGSLRLTYHFSASEELNDVLESSRGIFFAGSRRLGTINTRLSTKMTMGKGSLVEQLTIPLAIIKTAQRMGVQEIRYQRTFKARYMDAATTSSMAISVGTGFTFTHIRITFLDNTSKMFVKRRQKIDGAKVMLTYEGAGLLKGYWQVDDRILARVTKNLPYSGGRTITLTLPKVPALPTHSIGSHRLRFVITNPVMRIPFPQVIYIVTGEDLSTLHPIRLINPGANDKVAAGSLRFSWQPRHEVALYRLELLQNKGKKRISVFSAFSKKTSYTLPAAVTAKKLKEGTTCSWQVTGLDRNNKAVARSRIEKFTVVPAPLSFVPGRLLLLVTGQSEHNATLIDRLMKKYNLTLEKKKPLPGLGRELVLVTTSEDVESLSRRISAENKGVMVQPDYFYSTLGEIVETANLKGLLDYLHLQTLPTGKGRLVAVIDTGIDTGHHDLAAKLALHANFVDSSPYRGEIHGTAVAGIIGAEKDGRGTAGIAPQSRLLGLRACEQLQKDKAAGRCYSSSIIRALDRAVTEKADIVNMSIGTTAPDNMVAAALDQAADSGALLLAPAGNDPSRSSLAFPASHPRVVSVAGILENGRKFPNNLVADKADCILPAQYILATLPGGRVGFMNGTSMAAAEASGLLAAMQPDTDTFSSCRATRHLFTCLAAK